MTDQLERTVTQEGFTIRDDGSKKILELPIVVCGEVKLPTPENTISLSYGDDMEVRIPRLDAADVARIREADNRDIAALSIDDVAIFLNDLCKKWIDEDFEFRRLVTETIKETAGYVGPSIYYDLGLLSTALRRIKVYDMLESEIGDPYLLDEWLPRKTVYLHAEPRGKVTHIMVGNIPMAGLFSIVRSVMTKNMTIAKLPKRDAVTSLLFALSFVGIAPDHPITKSLTVAYWEPGSTIEDEILDMSDVVCAWGHEASIEPIKKRIRYGTEFVEFGPKRSLHLVGKDSDDLDYVAMKAAYDMSIYDQVACFSPQGDVLRSRYGRVHRGAEPMVEHQPEAHAENAGYDRREGSRRADAPGVRVPRLGGHHTGGRRARTGPSSSPMGLAASHRIH